MSVGGKEKDNHQERFFKEPHFFIFLLLLKCFFGLGTRTTFLVKKEA